LAGNGAWRIDIEEGEKEDELERFSLNFKRNEKGC
jgi:hypothetical protein